MSAEALDEPRGWRSVHDVVVEGDGEAQVLPGAEFTIDQAWLGSDTADSELEGVVRRTDGHPFPVPNIPTEVTATVPASCFHRNGNHCGRRQICLRMTPGRRRASLAIPASGRFAVFAWTRRISS